MKKIIKQQLDGDEETAKEVAQYTWQKDEIAWYFCRNYHDVFKVRFTGEHWLIGNKWGREKIYQFEHLESSNPDKYTFSPGSLKEKISHGEEWMFCTEKEEALDEGIRILSDRKNEAIKTLKEEIKRLIKKKQESIINTQRTIWTHWNSKKRKVSSSQRISRRGQW